MTSAEDPALRPRGDDSPEVLFVPYYYYISYDPFKRVILALIDQGVDARMLCMHFNTYDERASYSTDRLLRDGVPACRLDLDLQGMGLPGARAKVVKSFSYRRNRLRIRTFLHTQRPGVVVVESDLGGIYVRALLDECQAQAIPTAILMTLDVGQAVSPRFKSTAVEQLVNAVTRSTPWLKAILYRTEVAGSYALEAPILVPSAVMRERLISGGIDPARIQLVGSPHHDALFEIRNRDREKLVKDWLRLRGLPEGTRLLLLCTEVIEEVFGQQYVRSFYPLLAETFESLPTDCRVILRFHPRETQENLAFYRACFDGPRFLESSDELLDDLLRLADVCLGHFSSVLLKALAVGTPVLSVNLAKSSTAALFPPDQVVPQIQDETELAKISLAFVDPAFASRLRVFTEQWSKDHFPALDGGRTASIAGVVAGLARRSHAS